MKTGVYIWIRFQKENCQSSYSFLDWAGTVDIDEAVLAMENLKAEDILGKKQFSQFRDSASVSIIMREITTNKVLHTKRLV